MRTLLIDNYDSFTFNLFQLLAEVNREEPIVVRNDEEPWDKLATWDFDNIVISPGPGRPDREADFGVCLEALRASEVPVLGVCLGHQGLGYLYGAEVVGAPEVMHGRLSPIFHDGTELFEGIAQGFEAVRYHSLCVATPLPDALERTAWTDDGVVMGLRHRELPRYGVQFHPESICTMYGQRLIENFRDLTRVRGRRGSRGSSVLASSVVPRRNVADTAPPTSSELTLGVRKLERSHDAERCFLEFFASDRTAFWLDSSRSDDERSRFSFMGSGGGPLSFLARYDVVSQEVTVVRGDKTEIHQETIFDFIHRESRRMRHSSPAQTEELPFDFDCGFVGYFGYELKADCGGSAVHQSPVPDASLLFADRLLVFDHREGCTYLLCLTSQEATGEGEAWLDEMTGRLEDIPALPTLLEREKMTDGAIDEPSFARPYERYLADIKECHEHLLNGETYEVCLTNKVEVDATPEPLSLYRVLRHVNPAPYSAFLRFDDVAVLCSSPERFLRISRDRWVETKPMKGTARRGKTPAEDFALAEELRTSEKNRAENLMITDLLRNDLGLVCEIGSVHVPHLMAIETFETVHQMVSTIRGRLREDLGPADCVRACFPGGSMTGAPKKRTMEIIDELEQEARGVYSGSIGFIGLGGGSDLNIVIRTIVMDGQTTSIGTGGAIVMQSDPDEEFQEIVLKAQALLKAIGLRAEATESGAQDEDQRDELALAPAHAAGETEAPPFDPSTLLPGERADQISPRSAGDSLGR